MEGVHIGNVYGSAAENLLAQMCIHSGRQVYGGPAINPTDKSLDGYQNSECRACPKLPQDVIPLVPTPSSPPFLPHRLDMRMLHCKGLSGIHGPYRLPASRMPCPGKLY